MPDASGSTPADPPVRLVENVFVSLAASAHQGWSANMFTMASDMFLRRAVGSVVGIRGMAGSIGGMRTDDRRFNTVLNRLLPADFYYCRKHLSGRAWNDSPAGSASRTSQC